MTYDDLTKDELRIRLRSLEDALRAIQEKNDAAKEGDRLAHEPHVQQLELEAQSQAPRETQTELEASRSRDADLYDSAPISYCTFDEAGVVREINLTGARMLGRERAMIIGRPFIAVARFWEVETFPTHLRRCLESKVPVVAELNFWTDHGHVEVQAVSMVIAGDDGKPVGCRTAFVDISQRNRADRELRKAHQNERALRAYVETIDHASATISRALTNVSGHDLTDFLQIIVDESRVVANAEYAALGIVGQPGRPFAPWVFSGMDAHQAAAIGHTPRAIGLLGAVVTSEQSIRMRDLREHPAFSGLPLHHPGITSFLGVPIRFRGESRGNLYLANKRGADEFTQMDQVAIELLADRAGIAMEVARLRQIEGREHARLSFLAKAGPAFAESLSLEATLKAIGDVVVPAIGEVCELDLVGEDEASRNVMVRYVDPEQRLLVEQMLAAQTTEELSEMRRRVIRTGEPHVVRLSDEDLEVMVHNPSHREFVRRVGPRSVMVVPLIVRGKTIGALSVATSAATRPFGDDDLPVVQEIAHVATLAIDNARHHEELQRREQEQRFLAEAAVSLASTSDYREALKRLARLCVRDLADWCIVDIVHQNDELRRLAVVHRDPTKVQLCEALERVALDGRKPHVAAAALESRQPVLVTAVDTEILASVTQSPEHLQGLQALAPSSWIALPLLARERLIGSLVIVSSDPSPRFDSRNLALAQDLASRAAMGVENALLYEQAQRAVQTRDDMLAVVSHDLRGPLNNINLSVDVLSQSTPANDRRRGRKQVDIIKRSATRMALLIDCLRDATMIEAGHFTIESKAENVLVLIDDAFMMLESQAVARSLWLTVNLSSDVPPVLCDRERVLQVLTNLGVNAIKFTAPGGTIRMVAEHSGDVIRFSVADTGRGIPHKQLPHIFDQYWKGETRDEPGSGLGLYIAKGIVAAHGGRIWVESKVNEGSTFYFTLPVAPSPADEIRSLTSRQGSSVNLASSTEPVVSSPSLPVSQ